MLPYPSQSFAANRSTRDVSSSQSSLDLHPPSATQPTLVRAVGGIGEAPAQPKQPLSASHLISSTFSNPRLLNKFSTRQPSQNDTDTSGTLTHSSITLPTSLPYKRSHKKNYSDCQSISTDSHYHHIPTRSCTPTLPTVEIPSLITPQNRIPRDKPPPPHHQLPSFSRSLVTNLGLAPISTSTNHSLPPHPQYIPLSISHNPSSLHDSSILTRPSTHLSRSASQPSLIPSLLNQSRITKPPPNESIQHHQTEPTHPSTDSNNNNHHQHQEPPQPILAPPQEPCVANSPFQPAASVPEREYDSELSNPSHPRDPIIRNRQLDTDAHIRPVQLIPKVASKEPRKQPLSGFSFEPSGKSFIKYALPKPRLEATLATPPSKIAEKSLKKHHRRSQSLNHNAAMNTQSTIAFPREIPDSPCADTSMEILKERYWDAKHDDLDSQHVWAEIYISKLERQLWKSQAEEDLSADCLRLCIPLGSHNNTPQKPQHSRRRAASASDAGKPRPGILTSSTRVADHNQTKTQKRARFDFMGFHKAFPNDIWRMKWSLQPGSPLEISDGPLNRLPCINSGCSSSGVITPRRSDIFFPTRNKPPSIHLPATNSALLQPDTTPRVPPNIGSTYGYRIVRPTDNQQQLKSSRRRSRSVPDFRRVRYHPSSSPNLMNDTTGFPLWAPREAASPIDLPIPQSLIDAMFPPVSDSPPIATSYPSEFLLSVDSGNKAVRRVSSTKNLRTSVCADIEVSDNPDRFAFYDLPAVPDAPLEPTNKSHLQSLSRFTETRPPVVVPLPPPPRKRNNVTPSTGTNSSNQNSLVGVQRNSSQTKRSTGQTQHSTSDTNLSTVETKWSMSESMIANLSFATSSDKTGCNPPLHSSQRFTTHTSSSPLLFPEPLPDIRAHRVFPSFIQAPDLDLLSPQRARARSSSCAYPTSPTCDSPADSANRYSGFSQVSSPPCSMYAAHSYIERENRPSTFMAASPPLSALNLNPATQQSLPRYIQGASAHTCMPTIDVARTSCDSSPSESSNSVIDPDKPINQADLFYQVPASPRRSLIQDYDDNIVKSRRILEGHREKRKKAKVAKRSGLIDGILVGCASPRRTKIVVTRRSIIETQQLPTESVIDPAVQRGQYRSAQSDSMTSPADWSQRGSRSAVIQKVPAITDAFESH